MQTIREIIKQRDGVNDKDVDEMFLEYSDELDYGVSIEEALLSVFGLEPDFVFDGELLCHTNF